jgi:hypothetical protein
MDAVRARAPNASHVVRLRRSSAASHITAPFIAALATAILFCAGAPRLAHAAASPDSARVDELERKVNVLTEEIEHMKLGAAADTTTPALRNDVGLGPAAARVHDSRAALAVGGYGEMVLSAFDRQRQDGEISGIDNRLDLLRGVIYLGHRFSDELLLESEFEWEHAGVTDEGTAQVDSTGQGEVALTGEATLEFAFLEWSRHRSFGVRAGKMLVPVGLTNEIHEPPTLIGALRPDVENFVIPTTWSEPGAGVFGTLASGITYRAYVMSGLDGARFSAETAIREGRQGGSEAVATHPAAAVRLDWTGTPGLLVGGSYYAGNAWQRPQPVGAHLDPIVRLSEVHGKIEWHSLDLRALYVRGTLSQSVELSDQIGLVGNERLGNAFFGGYVAAQYDIMPQISPGSRYGLLPYIRYDESDTQDGVAPPGSENPALHITALTLGVDFRPHPDVALKAERQLRRNETHTATSQWNMSLGWMF